MGGERRAVGEDPDGERGGEVLAEEVDHPLAPRDHERTDGVGLGAVGGAEVHGEAGRGSLGGAGEEGEEPEVPERAH